MQLYYCKHCRKKFTPILTKHRTFPVRVILAALSLYNQLHTFEEAAQIVSRRFGIHIRPETARTWAQDFADYLPFLGLRPAVEHFYDRHTLQSEVRLFHGQVYDFKYHRAKTELLLADDTRNERFRPLQQFLERVPRWCTHQLFRDAPSRASKHKHLFNLDEVLITPCENSAIETTRFVLQAVENNRLRHETLQDFMVVNDSATIAMEVPIILKPEDLAQYRDRDGLSIP
jgi:hypothetical protein